MLNNIEAERARHNLSKIEIAERLKISPKTYRKWINEDISVPSSALIELSKMFNVSVDYLLSLTEESA